MFFVCYFSLGIANQEQRSLAQRCELWKKSSQEKDLVCERAEKDKAVLSEKIQVRRMRDYYLVAKRSKKPRGACRNPTKLTN